MWNVGVSRGSGDGSLYTDGERAGEAGARQRVGVSGGDIQDTETTHLAPTEDRDGGSPGFNRKSSARNEWARRQSKAAPGRGFAVKAAAFPEPGHDNAGSPES